MFILIRFQFVLLRMMDYSYSLLPLYQNVVVLVKKIIAKLYLIELGYLPLLEYNLFRILFHFGLILL